MGKSEKKAAVAVYSKPGQEAVWTAGDIMSWCPTCGAWAVVQLPPALLAAQPDATTHVCNPGFGGCNQGFELEVK